MTLTYIQHNMAASLCIVKWDFYEDAGRRQYIDCTLWAKIIEVNMKIFQT